MRLLGYQVTLRLGARAASHAPDGAAFAPARLRYAPLRSPRWGGFRARSALRRRAPELRTPATAVRGLRAFSRRLFSLLASAPVHDRHADRELARKQNANFV